MSGSAFTIETDTLLDKNKNPIYRANIFFDGEYMDCMTFKTEGQMMEFIQFFILKASQDL
jgi:hypothetical protein